MRASNFKELFPGSRLLLLPKTDCHPVLPGALRPTVTANSASGLVGGDCKVEEYTQEEVPVTTVYPAYPTLWTRTPSIFDVNLPLSANIEMCFKKKKLTMRTKAILYAICSFHHFFLSATFSLDRCSKRGCYYYIISQAGQD